jgi:D-glycerate 3-kinase
MDAVNAFIRSQALPQSYREMVDRIHRPAAERIVQRRSEMGRPIVVGLCGSQGSGKSTMAGVLKLLLEEKGLKAAVLSLDDLYLTHAERERLGRQVHPLLATRGVPGTHDSALGISLMNALRDGPAEVSAPRFDKAQDDRAAPETWPRVEAPVDIVLFEGWCVGARPQDDAALEIPVNALERDEDRDGTWRRYVNERLATDYAALFGCIDMLALLRAPSFEVVFGWRSLQEKKLADRVPQGGTRIMDASQIRRFLMYYQRLTEWILAEMPGRADILMPMDEDHNILDVTFR